MVERKVKICDACGERIATHQCKFCKRDLCDNHYYKFSIYTHSRESGVVDKLIISAGHEYDEKNGFEYICEDCRRKIEKILTIIGKKDLTFMLEKLWDYILELAKLEAL